MADFKAETNQDITGVLEFSKKLAEPESKLRSGPSESLEESSLAVGDVTASAESAPFDTPRVVTEVQMPIDTQTTNPLDSVKEYSESIPIGKPLIQPAFPFNLHIHGKLSPSEQEKLFDLITKHSMGISPDDLKIQLEQGRILLPRISEFAGILLVQMLRQCHAIFKLVPADEEEAEEKKNQKEEIPVVIFSESPKNLEHPAEQIPITQDSILPELKNFITLDTLTANTTLQAQVVETSRSSEYQEILEALKRKLKYLAYRKGASGIVKFTIQLTVLSSPTHYRLTVMGTAVKRQ